MVKMDRVFVASFLLVAQSCLIWAQCPEEELNVALEPLYSQLEVFKDQLDAVKLLIGRSVCSRDREEPLGMESGRIPDDHITASSFWNNQANHAPVRARPNIQCCAMAWANADSDSSPWIQVQFDSKVYVTGVITEGRGDQDQWVTEYEVKYSDDGQHWEHVTDADRTPKRFAGNTDRNTEVTTRFPAALHTKFLRILPTDWHNHCSMRFEVIGCPM